MNPQDIRKERERLGLTVAQCARMVCVAERTWRRWEDGSRAMPEGALELFKIKVSKPP